MQVTQEEIQVIARLVLDLCGIVLDESKGYLIEHRLSDVAQKSGCATFSEFYYKVRYQNDEKLKNLIIDAITTQETLFFRDASPFDALQFKVLPELIDARSKTAFPKRLRFWSAACSTGQEPYSIAMMLHEMLPDIHSWNINILATDIADSAIQKASLGQYSEHELQRGMKPQYLNKYFIKQGTNWKVKDELRALIAFKKINLLKPFPGMGPFDVIFCRNVAIYFGEQAKKDLFYRLAAALVSDGCLFVGSAESLTHVGPEFVPAHHCRAVFYQPNKHAVCV
jgi:chemotaxis protein methyltransferase CheR